MNIIKKWCDSSLILRILLIGLVCGSLLGMYVPNLSGIGLLGDVFVGVLKAVAPLLVFFLVASSLSGASSGFGSKFKICIALYLLSMFCAAFVAVTMSFIFPISFTLTQAATASAPQSLGAVFTNFILNMIANPIEAISTGNYIAILLAAVVFGFCFRVVAHKHSLEFISDCAEAMTLFIRSFIQLAPFGVMGLVFKAVSESGIEIFTVYGQVLLLIIVSILIVAFVTDPLISGLTLRRNPYPLTLTCLKESGVTAFFTRSSAANIPINLSLCERLGLDKDFYSVSIPLGATINMEGAAVTITVMTLTLCHTVGIGVSFPLALGLCLISTIAACGVAAVPNGALLLIPMAASLFGIGTDVAMQAVAVGFIISVIQDSFDTFINSSGDAIFSATAEYYYRKKQGEEVNFLGEFAKK